MLRHLVFVIATLVLGATSVYASDTDPAKQLLKKLEAIHSINGSFRQLSIDGYGQILQEQMGDFAINQDGKFRWIISPPYEQHIYSDGQTLSIFDPDLEQLTIKPVSEQQNNIPLLIFSKNRNQFIDQHYIYLGPKGEFILEPKQASTLFSKLLIELNNNGYPSKLIILDSLKQKTEVIFNQIEVNTNLSDVVFNFGSALTEKGIDLESIDVIDER